jgi:D-sedoheptulose 7-phosphate isomerase
MSDEISIEDYLQLQVDAIIKLKNSSQNIQKIVDNLLKAREVGGKIFIMGNGGSASTSTHFVADLLKTSITKNEKRFKAISLSDNIPVILAWSNDESFDRIFVEQLKNFLQKDDVVIGISGSGNSMNVINAINFANDSEAVTISLTGMDGGELSKISKINVTVPSNDMLTIETMHLAICHLLTTIIRSKGQPLFSY